MSNVDLRGWDIVGRPGRYRGETRMNNGWKTVSLGAVVELRNGVNFTQSSNGQSMKIVGVGDFQSREELSDFSDTSRIAIDGDVQQGDLLVDDDLLFVRSNGNKALVGRCIIVRNIHEPITFSGFTIRARVKGSEIRPRFLSQLVRSTLFQRHLHWFGSGSSINNLSQDVLSQFTFALPPLREQDAISEVIQTWDRAIESAAALLAAKRSQLRGIRRVLIEAATEHDHNLVRLAAITKRVRRTNDGTTHPVMTISAKEGFLLQSDKYARDMAGSSVQAYTILRRGEFAYNKGNSLTSPQGCVFRLDEKSALVPHVYLCFSLNREQHADFYVHVFESGYLNHQLSRVINSGVRNDGLLNLAAEDFFNCRVPVPPLDEQIRIARAINGLRSELGLHEKHVELLRKQKRGLMQKLLTGEWRVKADGGAL